MIRLTAFEEKHIPELLTWLENTDSEFLLQFAGPGYSFPLDSGQLLETLGDERYRMFRALERDSGEAFGHCQLMRVDRERAKASIGRVLVKSTTRGRGLGEVMLRELIKTARKAGLRRLSLRVFDFNTPAFACYKKLGFRETGRTKAVFDTIGKIWTSISMEYAVPKEHTL